MRSSLLILPAVLLVIASAAACGEGTDAASISAPGAPRLQQQAATSCIALEFDQDGVLPSSEGFTFFVDPPMAESLLFSASGGILHMNTFGTGVSAGYKLPSGSFDPALDFTLELRMKVLPGTAPFGVDFEVSDDVTVKDFEFGFSTDGILLPPPPPVRPLFPFDVTGDFHTYLVQSPGGSHDWSLTVDDVPAASGTASGGDPQQGLFIFGDLTFGGDGAAEIDFIRYCQVREIEIDVKPGSDPNTVNPGSMGVIPVAILTTGAFDAAAIDVGTVRFGAEGTEAAATHAVLSDVDSDADLDLLLHFRTPGTGITCATNSVALTAKTLDGDPVRGSDSLRTVGCS